MIANIRRWMGALLSVPLLAAMTAGCGTDASSFQASDKGGTESAVVITDFADREVTLHDLPKRIVALGNGEVDIVYALGGTLVGRPEDNAGLITEGVKDVPVVGSAHTVNLEEIAVVQPDVVLGNNPMNLNDIPLLEGIGSKVVLTEANSIDDIRRQIELFGKLLNKEDKASELIKEIDTELAQWKNKTQSQRRALIVYGAPGTFLAALPQSLAGNVLETAGGANIAAEYARLQNYPNYAQLNTERVVESGPDVIFIMTHGNKEDVEKSFLHEMEGNPAWQTVPAVRDGRIHVLPPELFGMNPGTRIAEAVHLLGELLHS
ncbi:ABC transporter substrate-binding protein [Paenibacillus sp. GCM10027627]|uniref:ABC transporter substrate-binding protein n=1 Tax=unclassified Paenibacillus TaxID=185978 RepID=UPI00362A50AC